MKKYVIIIILIFLSELSAFNLKENYLNIKSSTFEYAKLNKYPLLVSVGVLGSSFLFDRPIKNMVVHNQHKFMVHFNDFTNNFGDYKLVLPGLALVGTYGLISKDDKMYETVKTAFESCFLAGGLNLATKFVVGRERPFGTDNQYVFHPFSIDNKYNSFFSAHTTIAWSVFTPFALAYNNPYLYLIPISVNLARIYKNRHWLSDTLASTIVGFSSGYIIYHLNLDKNFKLNCALNSVNISYNF